LDWESAIAAAGIPVLLVNHRTSVEETHGDFLAEGTNTGETAGNRVDLTF